MTCALSQIAAEDPCSFSHTRLNEDGGLSNNPNMSIGRQALYAEVQKTFNGRQTLDQEMIKSGR